MSIDRDNLSKNLKNIKFDDELYTIQSGLIDFIDNSEISRDLLGEHRKSLTYDINRIENEPIKGHKNPFKIYLKKVFSNNEELTESWGDGREPRIPPIILEKFLNETITISDFLGRFEEFTINYKILLRLEDIWLKPIYDVNLASLKGGKKPTKKKSKPKKKSRKSKKKSKPKRKSRKSRKSKPKKKSRKSKPKKKSRKSRKSKPFKFNKMVYQY